MNFSGNADNGTRNKSFNFDVDLDHCQVQEIV